MKMVKTKKPATPYAKYLAFQQGIAIEKVIPTGQHGEVLGRDILNHKEDQIKMSPLAAAMMKDLGIDPNDIQGSGFQGKIMKTDIETYQEKTKPMEKEDTQEMNNPIADNIKPMSGMRKIIAARMTKSHQEIPAVTLHVKADVTELLALRQKLNQQQDQSYSINDFILKATCTALLKFPYVNTSLYQEDHIQYHDHIHLGIAVALPQGLIVPNIKNAETLSLKELSLQGKALIQKAKTGKLLPDDYQGGTFTISNLGSYGITQFNPIINQPEAGILGVCQVEDGFRLVEDRVEPIKTMGLSFTMDHRIMDGADGAQFIHHLKELLENPYRFLL